MCNCNNMRYKQQPSNSTSNKQRNPRSWGNATIQWIFHHNHEEVNTFRWRFKSKIIYFNHEKGSQNQVSSPNFKCLKSKMFSSNIYIYSNVVYIYMHIAMLVLYMLLHIVMKSRGVPHLWFPRHIWIVASLGVGCFKRWRLRVQGPLAVPWRYWGLADISRWKAGEWKARFLYFLGVKYVWHF